MEVLNDHSGAREQNNLGFKADGWEFLGILILNWILNSVTLMLYYPWSRVARIRFLYQSASLNGTSFVFHGTGAELFRGFIKVLVIFGLMFAAFILGSLDSEETASLVILGYILVMAVLIPLAIHGALRYRLSRTSWRGIRFGYRGERKQLFFEMVMGYVLVVLTAGLYTGWFIDGLRRYIIGHIRFGNLKFGYDGQGTKLFLIYLKGWVFGILTLGLYYFWFMKEWMNYFAAHTFVEQDGNRYYFSGNFSGTSYLGLMLVNFLLLVFTLGLATPFIIIRTYTYIIERLEIPQEPDLDRIAQTEDDYADATGEDVLDFLDLGII